MLRVVSKKEMRMLPTLIAALCLIAEPKPAETGLSGQWEVIEDWHDGKLLKSPGKVIKTFENGILTETVTPTPEFLIGGIDSKVTFRATPGAPRQIDFTTYLNGKKLGGQGGIFEIDGDSMKMAVAFPNEKRPTDFKPGEKKSVWTFKRVAAGARN
jgi:uncharacterized protein (TIGR03067 family)